MTDDALDLLIITADRQLRAQIADTVGRVLGPATPQHELDPGDPLPPAGGGRRLVLVDASLPWSTVDAIQRETCRGGPSPVVAVGLAGGRATARLLPPQGDPGAPYALGHLLDTLVNGEAAGGNAATAPGAARRRSASSEFLSRMSHELRTPLNAMLGFAQLLELDDLTADQRESVDHILEAGRELLAMINEVLDITRIESGRLSIEGREIDVSDAVDNSVDQVASLAAERRVTLKPATGCRPARVWADPTRLGQVLDHLLTNAVVYNRRGGEVEVRCRGASDDRVRVEVRDSGPGLTPELVDRLFTPFDRLGAERTGTPGAGLGLVLARDLVEAMGGTIGVESTSGEGTTVWIELPTEPQSRPAGAP